MSSDPRLDALLARALREAPAAEANAEIAAMREQLGAESGIEALSYEGVVPEQRPVEYLLEKLIPKLVYFLDCRGIRSPLTHSVFVSLFVGDRVFFLRTGDLFDHVEAWSGLAFAELVKRYGAG